MSKENQEKYSIDEFIMLLKEYDFKNNSIRKFANNYKISEKTVVKYLKKNNIEYNSRTLIINRNRDVNGRYCLNIKKDFVKKPEIKVNHRVIINDNNQTKKQSSSKTKANVSYEEKIKRIMTPYT
jgi:hypothetical protein